VIVSMSRVTLLGPRRLQREVVESIQEAGALHIDHIRTADETMVPRALSEPDQADRAAWDAVRTLAEGLLALLPVIEIPIVETAPFASQSPAVLRARLTPVDAEAKDLTRRLLNLEEELELLRAYGPALAVVGPLLALLETSKRVVASGFVLEAKPGAVEALRGGLAQAVGGRVELVGRPVDERRVGLIAACTPEDADAVRGVLTRAGATEVRLPASVQGMPLAEAVPHLEARRRRLPAELEDVRSRLMRVSQQSRPEVTAIATVARDAVHRFELMAQIPQSRYAFTLYGWVPTRQVGTVLAGLKKRFGADVLVYDEPAPVHHAEHVPVLLDNPGWVKPFQLFLAIFDPPKYGTFDPTIFFAIGLPLWVGLIVGDVGYGLLWLAITLFFVAKAKAGRPWRAVIAGLDLGFTLPVPVLRQVATLLGWMTAWIMIFGVIFGECFGQLPQRFFPGFHPLFDRVEGLTTYLYLSVGFGLAHVYLGQIMHMVKAVRHHHRRGVLEAFALLSGGTAMFLWVATQAHVLPSAFFSPVILGAVVVFLLALILSFSLSSLMWVMESISTFGAFVSYARIFGVGMAAVALAIVANTIGSGFGVLVLGLFVGAIAHLIFFGMTIIGHVLQPARLFWVEFFSSFKYYEDTGHRYRPFQRTGGGVS